MVGADSQARPSDEEPSGRWSDSENKRPALLQTGPGEVKNEAGLAYDNDNALARD
jgi:hypothetical protein